jgi:TetR/AcrR family transcriptional repressor of nem operon
LAPHDGDIRALAQAHAREVTGLLASVLGKAQRRGEIDKAKDPVALAGFFYNTLLGISVAARAFGGGDSLRQTAQMALRVLD